MPTGEENIITPFSNLVVILKKKDSIHFEQICVALNILRNRSHLVLFCYLVANSNLKMLVPQVSLVEMKYMCMYNIFDHSVYRIK